MTGADPGLDGHGWSSELAALEDDLADAPAEALPELLDLATRALRETGFDVSPAQSLGDPEITLALRYGRELVDRLELGEEIENDDAFAAAAQLRELVLRVLEEPHAGAAADMHTTGPAVVQRDAAARGPRP